MVKRPGFVCGVLLACLLFHAAAAYGAAGDPEAGSPSGGVYELPLEKGRADAAPGGDGSATAPEGGGGSEGGEAAPGGEGGESGTSYYRSENNFGSSSHVPGTDGKEGGGNDGAAGAAAGGGGGESAPSGPDAEPTSAKVSDTGNTSVAGNIGLLAAIGVLAALVAAFFARRRRVTSR